MKKHFLILIALISLSSFSVVFGQRNSSKKVKHPMKIAEIQKRVNLDEGQIENLMKIYDEYKLKMDSAIHIIMDEQEAALLISNAKNEFEVQFMSLLSEEQKTEYLQNKVKNKMPMKIAEILKMVTLDKKQQKSLMAIYRVYKAEMDSAIYIVSDKTEASTLMYTARKKFNTQFMDMLSDDQVIEYIRASSHMEVMNKANAKIESLRESGEYSEEDLKKFTGQIFEYFMMEKIVYARDKYDIKKQKENIAQLKKLEPASLKKANALQKVKHQGKPYQNGFQW